jgi:hypothetical protein
MKFTSRSDETRGLYKTSTLAMFFFLFFSIENRLKISVFNIFVIRSIFIYFTGWHHTISYHMIFSSEVRLILYINRWFSTFPHEILLKVALNPHHVAVRIYIRLIYFEVEFVVKKTFRMVNHVDLELWTVSAALRFR